MSESFYVTFTKPPPTHPDISIQGYAVIEATSIWDAAEGADRLFAGEYHLIFGTPYWERYTPNYPDGEQLRVTTGKATVESLQDEPPVPRGRLLRVALDPAGLGHMEAAAAPDYPEISSR